MTLQPQDFEQDKDHSNAVNLSVLLKVEAHPAYNRQGRGNLNSPSAALSRKAIVRRCYRTVDMREHYFSREIVDVAMSILDAYLYTKGGDMYEDDNSEAEGQPEPAIKLELLIASSACLFLAIKVYEPDRHFDIPTLVRINNNQFTRQDIVDAEKDILITLDFKLSPPTIMSFIRIYLAFLKGPESTIAGEPPLSEDSIKHVTNLAKFLSELSLYDLFFVDKDASKIALACVLTAFEGISRDAFPQAYRQRIVDCVYREGKLDCTDECVYKCRLQLRNTFESRRSVRREEPS